MDPRPSRKSFFSNVCFQNGNRNFHIPEVEREEQKEVMALLAAALAPRRPGR
jgi:hypothetical protein